MSSVAVVTGALRVNEAGIQIYVVVQIKLLGYTLIIEL